jgi:hypothetical protein
MCSQHGFPRRRLLAACVVLLGATPALTAQEPREKTDTTRGLSIAYADGRVVTSPLRRTGGMWTPEFPRVAGAETTRNGLPLSTLDVKHVMEGEDVVLTVSLSYGGPGRNTVAVDSVRLSAQAPVQIDALRRHGVEPIRVSLVAIPASASYAPSVTSASSRLFARAEPVGSNASAYRVLLTNDAAVPLMWLQYKAYRGDRVAIVGWPKGRRSHPLVLPGADYAFEFTTNGGAVDTPDGGERWTAIDRIEIASLIWQDGTVEGDPQPAAMQRRSDQRRTAQIAAVLQILRSTPWSASLTSLRQQIATSLDTDLEARRARDGLLADLDAFIGKGTSPDAPAVRAWRAQVTDDFAQWLARIEPPGAGSDAPSRP